MRSVAVVKKEYQTVIVDTINEVSPVANADDVIYDSGVTPITVEEAIDELFSDKHTHANKQILDAIEEPFTTADRVKLDSFNEEAVYVETSRNINTLEGLSGGGNLEMDKNLKLSLKDLPEDSRENIDPFTDFIITVDGAGNQYKTKIGGLVTQGATRVIGYVAPTVDLSTTSFTVIDGVMEVPPTENTSISQGVPPVTENPIFKNVDGYTFIVRLPDELKQTGFLSSITGTDNLVFDEDQFIWSSAKNQWVQMEVGDAVISVHGRVGNVVGAFGDYTAKQVVMADGNDAPTSITVQSEIEVRAKTNGNEIIDGQWLFRTNFIVSPKTTLPASPNDGQVAYYDNGVDAKYLVIYKVLSTLPTAGIDGWYKVSDDTLVV